MSDVLLNSLAAAVAASPEDPELRALYAERLADAGQRDVAIGQAMVVLSKSQGHAGAQALIERLTGEGSTGAPAEQNEPESRSSIGEPDQTEGVDWGRLEHEIGNEMPPPFVVHETIETPEGVVAAVSDAEDSSSIAEVSRETLRLSDVGGLIEVKRRIHETFLDPIAHPEIAKAFKKSLGGGLLLYGPPGCGKTYLARAIAGELGASFISVTLADVLSKWLGESEGNIHKTFAEARQKAPAVLFLDEVDAVGGKRSSQNSQSLRNIVNQLLMEMDGVGSDNDGLFVLAATNMPWDVDAALLRPGRFDRMVLVSPPDEPAREAILRGHLDQRPVQGIDLEVLVRKTEGFSGADLKHLCDTAAEKALAASIKSGAVQPVSMSDMNRALKEVKPSIGPWLDSARNVANYANGDGRYDDLVRLLKRYKRL
ncbi:ATP-binding protein [Leucobacter ruminantium]|uniref:ATP-binding protein n=1 Tax=Leucobacter ruminantium TaxID=1289170 RepID=A0A939LYN5_9MICO|nr:ATP-binding protein [Leucobacter ruminantium]MBO1805363.1 ATP-binding protein [Leucobacter ruminantium]